MESPDRIVIVSGLPRSGTSLMMQMLRAGGIPLLTDGVRREDESNPRGYFEYEKVKSLARDNSWMAVAHGKAVKVIVQLLHHLPLELSYDVLFMQRPIVEIVRSQAEMLGRMNGLPREAPRPAGAFRNPEQMATTFQRHRETALQWVRQQPNMRLLAVEYAAMIQSPTTAVAQINSFLRKPELDAAAMAAVVDPQLYRTRLDQR